jgi:hypothetical protein
LYWSIHFQKNIQNPDEEEIEQKAEERKRKGQDPDWGVILNRTAADPLVVCQSAVCCSIFLIALHVHFTG